MRFKYLKGLGKASKYVAIGFPFLQIYQLSHFKGFRKFLECLYLSLQLLTLKKKLPHNLQENLSDRHFKIKEGLNSAFFMDTSWYKGTFLVGIIKTNKQQPYFIKYFKNQADADNEFHRSINFYSAASNIFTLSKCVRNEQKVLYYEYLENSHKLVNTNTLAELAIKLVDTQKHKESLPIHLQFNFDEILKNTFWKDHDSLYKMFSSVIHKQWENSENCYLTYLAHGDYTPWNSFFDKKNEICLIDYERSTQRVLFCDFFHLFFQDISKSCFKDILDKIEPYFPLNKNQQDLYYLSLYLLEEISLDLSDYTKTGGHYYLNNLIVHKVKSFIEASRLI